MLEKDICLKLVEYLRANKADFGAGEGEWQWFAVAVGFNVLDPQVLDALRTLDTRVMRTLRTNLAAVVRELDEMGYRGDYSFEVFNDDYQAMPLATVARRARQSALWLGESVLRRSVPLPNQMRLRR